MPNQSQSIRSCLEKELTTLVLPFKEEIVAIYQQSGGRYRKARDADDYSTADKEAENLKQRILGSVIHRNGVNVNLELNWLHSRLRFSLKEQGAEREYDFGLDSPTYCLFSESKGCQFTDKVIYVHPKIIVAGGMNGPASDEELTGEFEGIVLPVARKVINAYQELGGHYRERRGKVSICIPGSDEYNPFHENPGRFLGEELTKRFSNEDNVKVTVELGLDGAFANFSVPRERNYCVDLDEPTEFDLSYYSYVPTFLGLRTSRKLIERKIPNPIEQVAVIS